MMRRTLAVLLILALGLWLTPFAAEAPPVGKVYRIGYLATTPPPCICGRRS
jgi:hypothetical protein